MRNYDGGQALRRLRVLLELLPKNGWTSKGSGIWEFDKYVFDEVTTLRTSYVYGEVTLVVRVDGEEAYRYVGANPIAWAYDKKILTPPA